MIKFCKPSLRRALVCILAVTLIACVSVGIVLYAVAIVTHNDPTPTPVGDYVRLLLLDLTFWGPITLITGWPIFVPVILALGTFVAAIRVVDPPDEDGAS
ncbi:hypothetical protein [Mycolicibacterium brisbanense]